MKNRDLIKQLSELDPDAIVLVTSANFELNHALVPADFIQLYTKGSTSVRRFRDAFDGEPYNKEVYSTIGGVTPVILIS